MSEYMRKVFSMANKTHETYKVCTKCGENKAIRNFRKERRYTLKMYKNPKKMGKTHYKRYYTMRRPECKKCQDERRMKAWRRNPKQYNKAYRQKFADLTKEMEKFNV